MRILLIVTWLVLISTLLPFLIVGFVAGWTVVWTMAGYTLAEKAVVGIHDSRWLQSKR